MDLNDVFKQLMAQKKQPSFSFVITNDPHILFKEITKPTYNSVCSAVTTVAAIDNDTLEESEHDIKYFIITHKQ